MLAAHGYAVVAANPRGSSGYGTRFQPRDLGRLGQQGLRGRDGRRRPRDRHGRGRSRAARRRRLELRRHPDRLRDHQDRRASRPRSRAPARSTTSPTTARTTTSTSGRRSWACPGRTRSAGCGSRPSSRSRRSRTPTLILCGEDDMNVPLLNSEQLYQALRRLGRHDRARHLPGPGPRHRQAQLREGPLRALPRLVRPLPGPRRRRRTAATARRRRRCSACRSSASAPPAERKEEPREEPGQGHATTSSRTRTTPTAIDLAGRGGSPTSAASARRSTSTRAGSRKHPRGHAPAPPSRPPLHHRARAGQGDRRPRSARRSSSTGKPDAGGARRRSRTRRTCPTSTLALQRLLPPRARPLPEGRLRERAGRLPRVPEALAGKRRPAGGHLRLALHDAAAAGPRRRRRRRVLEADHGRT